MIDIVHEEWKDIVIEKNGVLYNYTGYYMISNYGRVYSVRTAKMLKLASTRQEYAMVALCVDGVAEWFSVHRLVATMFIPNPKKLPFVNHKDENKQNNCVTNLEWCDAKYNINYGTARKRQSETRKSREYNITASDETKKKLSDSHKKKVICLNTGEVFDSANEACDKYNAGHICKCCKGYRKTSGKHPETGEKLKWMYYDEWLEQQNK